MRNPSRRRLAGVVAPLGAIAVLGLALVVLLVATPLNELPDTYCETLASHGNAGQCSSIYLRREHWIILVLVATVVVGLMATVIRLRYGAGRTGSAHRATLALVYSAVGLGVAGATVLLVDFGSVGCGSTLSRVDEFGSYSPERAVFCAPEYAASRRTAGLLGSIGGVLFLAGTGIRVRSNDERVAVDSSGH